MELSSQQTLPVSQTQAWQALNDIDLLQATIPGCQSITLTGENHYALAVTAAVGPLKANFKGKLHLADLQPPTSYVIHFEGHNPAAGHGKGKIQVHLEAIDNQQTRLHYSAQASVGGKIAQIGSRLIDMAAQKMAHDFFAAFSAALHARYAPTLPPPTPPQSLLARFAAWWAAWWHRLFGQRT